MRLLQLRGTEEYTPERILAQRWNPRTQREEFLIEWWLDHSAQALDPRRIPDALKTCTSSQTKHLSLVRGNM
jgi:hypothetical protein